MQLGEPIHLPMWAGYQAGTNEPSLGAIKIMFHGEKITPRQRAASKSILPSATRTQPILLDAIVGAYPTFREWKPRPKLVTASQLRKLIALFDVMTHLRRIVEVGGADTAILGWIAESDLERRNGT